MNADPDEGQPTAVPEATAPEATAAWDPAELEATGDEEAPEDEAPEPEVIEAGSAEPDVAPNEAAEPEAAAADTAEAEPAAPEAAEPEPAFPQRTTPLVAGRYRLVSEIGGGAMGVVWRGRDEVLGRDVAVKELRPDHGMSGAQVRTSHQRARREGRIAARLQHPNAVVIYDVAEHDGRPYLIMEYVPSQSLGDILATGAVLTPTEVTSIGAQLASALTAAHERGIVHRDIKPGNVLMTSDGTVKLTDFGISRAAGDATVTATGEILGTPAYTAPEVAQGHPVAFPADVFSLGATLYAAVEGTPPFGEDVNAMALLLRVVRNEIRQPRRSGPLTDTIMRMLSPEPVDRPTMKQVWQGLDGLATSRPLPVADARAAAPATKAFDAPSPTLVVMESAVKESSTLIPERPVAIPLPAPAREPEPEATPEPEPTSTPASETSSDVAAAIAATPTSAMLPAATPTKKTQKAQVAKSKPKAAAKPQAAASPATPPPPTDDSNALTPASPAQPPERRSRSRMPLAITICVVGTAVLVVAIVVAMNGGDKTPNQPVAHGSTASTHSAASPHPTTAGSSSHNQAATAPSTSASSGASSQSNSSSPSTSSSSSTPSASATDTAAQLTAFITNYYALLPNNTDAAWPQLTTAYQTSVAVSRTYYNNFWAGYKQVTVSDVQATLPSTVIATIHYVTTGGQTTTERTSFGVVKDGGVWKINTSHVLD